LRLAAIDRRLEKHQEAYGLWWKLRGAAKKRNEIGPVVLQCQDWWVNNGLYLDKNAREAFYRAYLIAGTHSILVEPSAPRDESSVKAMKDSWETILKAAEAIENGVELPSIRIPDEDAKEIGGNLGG
jgi:hypothetical protein